MPSKAVFSQRRIEVETGVLEVDEEKIESGIGPLWSNPLLMGQSKGNTINVYAGSMPSVDVDHMSKPILDDMQPIVYADDGQVV